MAKHAQALCVAGLGLMSIGVWAESEVLPPAAPPSVPVAVPVPKFIGASRPVPAAGSAPAVVPVVPTASPGAAPVVTPTSPTPPVAPATSEATVVTPPVQGDSMPMSAENESMPTLSMSHRHGTAGTWMFEYRYARTVMRDLLHGSEKVSAQELFTDPKYRHADGLSDTMANEAMTMDMNMLMVMYSMTDRLTLTGMIDPYVSNSMDMTLSMDHAGMDMPMMKSKGFGDVELGLIYKFDSAKPDETWKLGAALSLPTGSVDAKSADGLRLPYSMQLGSGTLDLKLALTYDLDWGSWGFGGQVADTARIGRNKHGWTPGDRQELSAWSNYRFGWGTTAQAKLAFSYEEKINGSDSGMGDPAMYAGLRPENYGGVRTDLIGTLSHSFGSVTVSGNAGFPIYQNLNGVQLRTTWLFGFAVSYTM